MRFCPETDAGASKLEPVFSRVVRSSILPRSLRVLPDTYSIKKGA